MDVRRKWKAFYQEEKGSIAIYVAAAMMMLFASAALAVDVGSLALAKTQLSNWADAAALAGVQELPENPALAEEVAEDYFFANVGEETGIGAEAEVNGNELVVTAVREVPLHFAKVLGMPVKEVSARARAKTGTITGLWGIVPLCVEEQEFVFGQLYELKVGGGDGYTGNYGALALGGRGADNYENNLSDGYHGIIRVGDKLTTEPGNMSGPTRRGIEERIESCDDGCTPENYLPDCPRVIYLPIVDSLSVNGRDEVTVVGFAAFFLEDVVPGSGNKSIVKGYFLKRLADGEISDDVQGGYGLRGVKLVE